MNTQSIDNTTHMITGGNLEDLVERGGFFFVDEAILYLKGKRYRHVGTVEILQSYGPEAFVHGRVATNDPLLLDMKPGPLVPKRYSPNDWVKKETDSFMDMREIMVSIARGQGIEIGAGPYALRFPLDTSVQYLDFYDMNWQTGRMWPGFDVKAVMPVDARDSFEELRTIDDCSQDFIAASHVIEHLANPVKAISNSYKKLKFGGYLFIVCPDKRHMFDRHRDTTTIEHLMEDFQNPSRDRDFQHHLDYHRLSAGKADYEDLARRSFESHEDIHFHTWTHESFLELIDALIRSGVAPYREVWWRPKVAEDLAMEFYVALMK